MITSNFFPAVSSNMWLRKIITRREIFAPFNCYLDILLALRNYSWISGLPLIEATNLCREGPALRVGGPAQRATHSLIKLTNIVNLYHSLAVFTSINWVDISDTAEENDIKPVVAFIFCNARLTIIIPLG